MFSLKLRSSISHFDFFLNFNFFFFFSAVRMKNWNVTNCLGISPTHRTQYCKDGSSSLHGRKYASYMYIYDAYIYPMHACGCYGAIFCCLTRQDNT